MVNSWESAHAWNLIILGKFIAWSMNTINKRTHLIFHVIPLSSYDVIYDITIQPGGTLL